jgi:hypothetical protein
VGRLGLEFIFCVNAGLASKSSIHFLQSWRDKPCQITMLPSGFSLIVVAFGKYFSSRFTSLTTYPSAYPSGTPLRTNRLDIFFFSVIFAPHRQTCPVPCNHIPNLESGYTRLLPFTKGSFTLGIEMGSFIVLRRPQESRSGALSQTKTITSAMRRQ